LIRQATAQLASMNPQPYHVNRVDRRWVMQTWSQTVDRTLALADLAGLAHRLSPPAGWRYEARTPASALRVDTTAVEPCVIQDDLANS